MKLKLYILSIIVLLGTSCSKVEPEPLSDVTIGFSTVIEESTKVDDYFQENEKLGIFGYNLNDGAVWDNASFAPDFMYNVALEYVGTAWLTRENYFWSNDIKSKKRFYAYYPYTTDEDDENIILSPAGHTGSPYINFTVTDAKTDFITCNAQEGNVENPTIHFKAKHTLAKVTIGFATELEHGMAYAKATKVYGLLKEGKFIFDKVAEGDNGFEIGTRTFDLELPQPATGEIYVNSPSPVYVNEYTLYILPPNTADGKGGIKKIETVINGVTLMLDLSSVPLASGKNTNIKIIINQKETTFNATIENWEIGGNATGTID